MAERPLRGEFYTGVGYLVGLVTFVGCWIYAVVVYGWFLGIGLGWLPSFFIAVVAGFLWPFIVVAIAVYIFIIAR